MLIYLATDSVADLSKRATERLVLTSVAIDPPTGGRILQLPHTWYVTREFEGCSCHFRECIVFGSEPTFGAPEDWMEEPSDDIEATQHLYDLIANLVREGSQVELIALWDSSDPMLSQSIDVSLSEVNREEFRIFENYRFRFR